MIPRAGVFAVAGLIVAGGAEWRLLPHLSDAAALR